MRNIMHPVVTFLRRRLPPLAAVGAIAAVAACSRKEPPTNKAATYPTVPEASAKGLARTNLDSPIPTQAQLDRRLRSVAAVKQMGLPVLESLPVVEDESTVRARSKQEVAGRCLATAICAVKGGTNDHAAALELADRLASKNLFSPKEELFLRNATPTDQELRSFSWGIECTHVFLWALGYLPALNAPDQQADVQKELNLLLERARTGLSANATLRPMSEILDMADLYYRLDWAAVELRVKGQRNDKANEDIIVERHRALNWLIRYMNQEWDDVTTDT